MQALHAGAALAGVALCIASVLFDRRRAGLQAAVLVALLGNAMITGGLSGPHDRYQSRVMWLPAFVLALALTEAVARLPARNRDPASPGPTLALR
jgi:putative Mn2+ efflux pump MntP